MRDDSLPDPVAYAGTLSDEELLGYKANFGENSREWVIAQRELSRRSRPAWHHILHMLFAFFWFGWLAIIILG